jgi:thiopeptide-type bacteriocin biosynthesis protein
MSAEPKKLMIAARIERQIRDPHDQLSAALENYIQSIATLQGYVLNEVDLGALVESANAAICRLISESSDLERWLYFRIAVESTAGANAFLAYRLAPMLRELVEPYGITRWWWLRKGDEFGRAVRLRIAVPSSNTKEITLDVSARLERLGCNLTPLRYEPELRLFGGAAGIKIAHDHFCADSKFLVSCMHEANSEGLPVIPLGLSLALALRLLRSSRLDLFESWDVFDRICAKRPGTQNQRGATAKFQRLAETVVHAGTDQIFRLYQNNKATSLSEYVTAIDMLGYELHRTYYRGGLECGIREFLAPVVLFHWNRAGIPGAIQSCLSHAVALELCHLSRAGTTQLRTHAEGQCDSSCETL